MLQFIFVPMALLLSGCQMLTQRAPAPEPMRTVIIEDGKAGAPPIAYVALPGTSLPPGAGADTIVISPKAFARATQGIDPQLEADIRAFSRMSKKSGGPAYALLPPPLCDVVPNPKRRGSKSKEPVCYATEEDGRVVVHMTRP